MIHILKNKAKQFYWVSVTTKANTFVFNGKASEFYTTKQNCWKSIKNEADVFGSTLPSTELPVLDHTKISDKEWVELEDHQQREARWVIQNSKRIKL